MTGPSQSTQDGAPGRLRLRRRHWLAGGVRRFAALWLLSGGMAMVLSCAEMGGIGQFNLISETEEGRLGQELSQEISQQGEILNDAVVGEYISGIGKRLVAVSQRPDYPYQFYVIKKDEVNAFAIPGGHMYVQTGLILEAEREAEVAAVMGHELGHAERRHTTQQMSRAYGVSLLTSVLLGDNPSQTQQIVSGLLGNATIMKYSRDAEREADWTAVHLLYRAGYDPTALAEFFKKLKAEEETKPGALEALFLSHPMTDERIANVEKEVSLLAPKKPTLTDNQNFVRIKERVKGL
ncbi:MAG: M48 family metallopeptidase [bacterium]